MSHDLGTEAGLLAYLDQFMGYLTSTFLEVGGIQLGVAVIATRYQGRRLPSPKVVLLFPNLEAPIIDEGFLSRAYRTAIDEHKATGVFTFGPGTSLEIVDPVEIEAWRGRNPSEHPSCYQMVSLKLEHTTFGVRFWLARVSKDGKLGPFELQAAEKGEDSECLQGDFFAQLRAHPSTA